MQLQAYSLLGQVFTFTKKATIHIQNVDKHNEISHVLILITCDDCASKPVVLVQTNIK